MEAMLADPSGLSWKGRSPFSSDKRATISSTLRFRWLVIRRPSIRSHLIVEDGRIDEIGQIEDSRSGRVMLDVLSCQFSGHGEFRKLRKHVSSSQIHEEAGTAD